MTDQRPEPPEDAGINALRLDADRTREELERTLDEIERRLDPRPKIEALKRAWRNRPVEMVSVAVAVVGAIGALAWAARSGNRRAERQRG